MNDSRGSEPSWLSEIQCDLIVECDAVRAGCGEVEVQLKELSKFADDDWGTTADEFVKFGKHIDSRKRKLAQSLVMVMNTQDVTPGFSALPALPDKQGARGEAGGGGSAFALAQRRRAAAGIVVGGDNNGSSSSTTGKAILGLETGGGGGGGGHAMGRNAQAIGGVPPEAHLDDQGISLAIEEFNLRIGDFDAVKRRLGGALPSDALALERARQQEASGRLGAMRQRLRWDGRFELYLFEEDEIARGEAFRRWKVCLTVVRAVSRLRTPLRRHARSRKHWRRALQVASAVSKFRREGEAKRGRGSDLMRATALEDDEWGESAGGGGGGGWGEGDGLLEGNDDGRYGAGGNEVNNLGDNKWGSRRRGSGCGVDSAWQSAQAASSAWGPSNSKIVQGPALAAGSNRPQGLIRRTSSAVSSISSAGKYSGKYSGGKGKGKGKGGKGGAGLVVGRPAGWVPPPDLEEKTAAYERAQQARVNWRRAIGAAKCIARMRRLPKDIEDDDAQFEFHYEETWVEVEDARTQEKRVVPIVRTELVDVNTGKLKVVAASNFNALREREQRDELKGTPEGPGVHSLLHAVKKRPNNDPKDLAAAQERQRLEKEAAGALEMQAALFQQMQMQQQGLMGPGGGGCGGGGGGGGAGFVTAAQFKENERQKKLAKELAEEQEKRRLEDEEKNFSYLGSKADAGLSWHELTRNDKGAPAAAAAGAAAAGGAAGAAGGDQGLGGEDVMEDISPLDVAPEEELRFIIWENVRTPRFEAMIFVAILANCVQLALYNPEVDVESSGAALFMAPWTPFKMFEIVFMFLFPTESALKVYAYRSAYFSDFWNKIDFFCVLLIFINLVPGIPNLTVIRTLRMLKPLRSIARLPTLKVIVTTLVRSAQQIIDVYVICFFVFMVFAVLAMDLFGGAFAQTCLSITHSCSSNPEASSKAECSGEWEQLVVKQPATSLSSDGEARRCGVYACEDGFHCYLGNAGEFNPEGGAQSFDNIGTSLLTVFIFVTRKGWVRILNKLWDTYGFVAPTVIALVLLMFGSYLLTQLITAAITVTYEKVDDEMMIVMQKMAARNKAMLQAQGGGRPDEAEDTNSESDSDDDDVLLNPSAKSTADERAKKRKKKDAYALTGIVKYELRPGILGKWFGLKRKVPAMADKDKDKDKDKDNMGKDGAKPEEEEKEGGAASDPATTPAASPSPSNLPTQQSMAGGGVGNPTATLGATIGGGPATLMTDDDLEAENGQHRGVWAVALAPVAAPLPTILSAAAAAAAAVAAAAVPHPHHHPPFLPGSALGRQERRQRTRQQQQQQLQLRPHQLERKQHHLQQQRRQGQERLTIQNITTATTTTSPALSSSSPTGLRNRKRTHHRSGFSASAPGMRAEGKQEAAAAAAAAAATDLAVVANHRTVASTFSAVEESSSSSNRRGTLNCGAGLKSSDGGSRIVGDGGRGVNADVGDGSSGGWPDEEQDKEEDGVDAGDGQGERVYDRVGRGPQRPKPLDAAPWVEAVQDDENEGKGECGKDEGPGGGDGEDIELGGGHDDDKNNSVKTSMPTLPCSSSSSRNRRRRQRQRRRGAGGGVRPGVVVVGGAPGDVVTDSDVPALDGDKAPLLQQQPSLSPMDQPATMPPPPGTTDLPAHHNFARQGSINNGMSAGQQQELMKLYQANPFATSFTPKRGRLYNAVVRKCNTGRPKWTRWRGFRPLRKVTRHPLFDQLLYLAIILNMYVMTFSDVRTFSCPYTYDAGADSDALGKAYTLQLASEMESAALTSTATFTALANSTATLALANSTNATSVAVAATAFLVPEGDFTLDGGCVRGAKLLVFSSELGAIPPGDPKYILAVGEQITDLCSLVFLIELILRFTAHGFKYFDSSFNRFDALVVVATVVDIWEDLPGASAARFFRVANLVAKTTRLASLRKIVASIFNSLGPLSGVVSLAFLMLFVFAVGGLQLYGLNLPAEDRINFRDFPHAILTVFIMFTGDGWSQIMYKIMHEEGPGNSVFFVFFTIYGMFGLSMLILATLISKFDCGSKDDFKLSNVLPINDCVVEVKRLIHELRKGGKRAQMRRERNLADLRRRGLLVEEEKDGKGGEESKEGADAEEGGKEGRKKRAAAAAAEEDAKKDKKKAAADAKGDEKGAKEDRAVVTAPKSARDNATEAAKEAYFVQAEHTVLKEHPTIVMKRNALATSEQIAVDSAPEELTGSIGYGFCRIEHDSAIREKFLSKIVDQPKFEAFIMACIILSCAMLAYEGPGLDEDDPLKGYFAYVDLAFLGIFVVECVLRVLHKGLLFTNVAYLKDPWNQVDFFIVVTDVVSTVFSSIGGGFANFRGLRGFRALRPLRALKKAPELRAVVDVIANCLPVFINLALCSLTFYAVGGVFMMKFFSGRFWRCNDPAVTEASQCGGFFDASPYARPNNEYMWPDTQVEWHREWGPVATAQVSTVEPSVANATSFVGVPLTARHWYNAPRNFDTTSAAMLTIFELSTLDHWVEVLFLCMDSSPLPGETTSQPGTRYGFAFLVVFIVILGNYLLMNLLVCGVVVVYDILKADSRHNPDLTRGQRELLDALQLMLRTRPGYRQRPPDPLDAAPFQLHAYRVVMYDAGSLSLKIEDQRGTTFELIISALVILNTILLGLYSFETPERGNFIRANDTEALDALQDTPFRQLLNFANDGFSALFFLEMLLKVYAFGFFNYWRDTWNVFDFCVVWSGLFQTLIDGFMGFAIIPANITTQATRYVYFDPKTFRVLRVVRLVRVVRLLKSLAKYDRIQSITQLVDTLSNCIKHIVNVFGLWLLVTVTFALIAMTIFGDIPFKGGEQYKYGVYNEYTNFSSFSQALVTLFKVATLDDWSWLMRDVMQGQREKGEFPFGWVFFVIYLVVTAFLFLNIFTAIVMDQYDFTARVTSKPRSNGLERQIMTFNQASVISEEWSYLDPTKTDFIDDFQVRKLLFKIGYPVGYKEGSDRALQLRHLRRMELRMTGMSRQVHYVDFFISCALMRYRQQRKPIADIDLDKVRGKIALEIQIAFPTIMDNRLEDTGGMLAPVHAVEYIQGQYRGLVLRRMMAAGDKEGLQNYSENRQRQMEKQAQMRQLEDEQTAKAAKKASASSKGSASKGKGRKK